jgi:hypothetical protein
MKFLSTLRTFSLLQTTEMLLLIEAFLLLGMVRLLIFLPFSKISTLLGSHMDETPPTSNLSHLQLQKLKNIKHAIEIMSRYTFWESKCLVKAISAMIMLKRRKIESTLYLGTAKEEGDLVAHAWLRSGEYYVAGSEVMRKFTVVAYFANKMDGENHGRNV